MIAFHPDMIESVKISFRITYISADQDGGHMASDNLESILLNENTPNTAELPTVFLLNLINTEALAL